MNRTLWIPAVCCAFAFVALATTFRGATGRETISKTGQSVVTSKTELLSASAATPSELMSSAEAEQLLTAIADEYTAPWRQAQATPRNLYSRIAPRPIPSIKSDIELVKATDEGGQILLATVAITTGEAKESIPCVVDRRTKQVSFFAAKQWQTQADWVKTAPSPFGPRNQAMPGSIR
ncbi:hypothetical protein NA78x_003932 [Anatilimnocola sp. NA78]|uniref:hypothetical protein n=1 Tax=Anatilimnocola sp. NA78 TaxID=3415683 RepID=UPI003CE5C75C